MRLQLLLVLSLLTLTSFAGITVLDGELYYGDIYAQRFGAYTANDSPFGGSINASLDLSLSYNVENNGSQGAYELLAFFYEQKEFIGKGGSLLEGRVYCCKPELANLGYCSTPNTLIFSNISLDPSINGNTLYYFKLNSSNIDPSNNSTINFNKRISLSKTGIWYLFIANCDNDQVRVNGTTKWINPFGYLSGQILGFLPLYWIMATGYLVIGIAWSIATCIYRKDLMKFQHAITFVIAISILENLLWASDYTVYDFKGVISIWANIFGALFTATKLTAIRTLVLLVAVGYTITRPVLPRAYIIGISFLTILYFIVEGANSFMDVATSAGIDIDPIVLYVDLILLVLVNAAIFAWIGVEMYATLKKLKTNEGEKLGMYKRLSILLVLSITLSIAIVITQLVIEATDQSDFFFRVWWLFSGYWEFIYFACIFYVSWVWRPSDRNSRFAYSELLENEDTAELAEHTSSPDKAKIQNQLQNSESVSSDESSTDESSGSKEK